MMRDCLNVFVLVDSFIQQCWSAILLAIPDTRLESALRLTYPWVLSLQMPEKDLGKWVRKADW